MPIGISKLKIAGLMHVILKVPGHVYVAIHKTKNGTIS